MDLIDFATESYVVALAMMICNFDDTDDLFDGDEDILIEERAEQVAQAIYEEVHTRPNIGTYKINRWTNLLFKMNIEISKKQKYMYTYILQTKILKCLRQKSSCLDFIAAFL